MRVTRRSFATAAASFLIMGPVGCAGLAEKTGDENKPFMERLPFMAKKEEAPEPYPNPVKLAATWAPDSLVQTGRTPTRGFGGRVFFYDEKSRPVPVDGTLIVHGFDDTAENPEDRIKRYEFTPEQFTRHFSQTDLGASYSVWIPWDAVGGKQRRISLVASFRTADGKPVQGEPAVVVLPGTEPPELIDNPIANFSPKYQQYKEAQASLTPPKSGLTTTTIQRSQYPRGGGPDGLPGIKVPKGRLPKSMIADLAPTPSADVQMARRATAPTVRPVSAQMPVKRK